MMNLCSSSERRVRSLSLPPPALLLPFSRGAVQTSPARRCHPPLSILFHYLYTVFSMEETVGDSSLGPVPETFSRRILVQLTLSPFRQPHRQVRGSIVFVFVPLSPLVLTNSVGSPPSLFLLEFPEPDISLPPVAFPSPLLAY